MRSRTRRSTYLLLAELCWFVICAQKQCEKCEAELGHLSAFGWAMFVFVSRWEHILHRYNRTGWMAVKHQVNPVQHSFLLLTFWAHLPKHSKMLEEWVNSCWCGWKSRTDLGECTHTQYDETQGNNSTFWGCVCVTYFERWLTCLCLKYKLFVVVVVVVDVVVVVYAGAD